MNLPDVKISPPVDIMQGCDKLLHYDSNDVRDLIKTTVRNHNIYFLCASKLDAAIMFIKQID